MPNFDKELSFLTLIYYDSLYSNIRLPKDYHVEINVIGSNFCWICNSDLAVILEYFNIKE